jgi:hypothetical protein
MKNIFECVMVGDHIWFPNFIHYAPQSFGFQRRKWIFQQAFPEKTSSICSTESWNKIKENRVVFAYDEKTKTLTKQENK